MAMTTAERNTLLREQILSNEKSAADGLQDYIRRKLYERGFARDVMKYDGPVSPNDLDRQLGNEESVKIFELEPEIPMAYAYSVNYNTGPSSASMHTNKFLVRFQRNTTVRMEKDIALLRGYDMDLRQIISDLLIRVLETKEDSKLISTINFMLGAWDSVCPSTGVKQSVVLNEGFSRDTWTEAKKILPRSPSRLNPDLFLVNNINMFDFEKWGRDEAGGDFAEQTLVNGFSATTLGGKRLKATIKHELVPENVMYHFADQRFVGKFLYMQDTTMSIKAEDWLIQYYAWNETGMTIPHAGGIARVKFDGTRP